MKKTNEQFEVIMSPHILKPHDNEERLRDLAMLLVDAYLDRRDSLSTVHKEKLNPQSEGGNHV